MSLTSPLMNLVAFHVLYNSDLPFSIDAWWTSSLTVLMECFDRPTSIDHLWNWQDNWLLRMWYLCLSRGNKGTIDRSSTTRACAIAQKRHFNVHTVWKNLELAGPGLFVRSWGFRKHDCTLNIWLPLILTWNNAPGHGDGVFPHSRRNIN